MLIYVIPLILLIIVLIVFKKRQDAQGSDKANAAKTAKNKKLATASKAAPQKAKVVEDIVPQKQEAFGSTARSNDINVNVIFGINKNTIN